MTPYPKLAVVAACSIALAGCQEDPTTSAETSGPTPAPTADFGGTAVGFRTSAPPQAELLVDGELVPLATAGDVMPGSGERLAGIPDGIGTFGGKRRPQSYMNHEISGAAKVSKFTFDAKSGTILHHDYTLNGSEGYNRLCSASWNGRDDGFPGGYFFTGEEASDGIQLAIDRRGNVTEMKGVGYYAHEQQIAVPGFKRHTVVVNFDDDGTSGGDLASVDAESELYMYVSRSSRQMLRGKGQLYVFASDEARNVGDLNPGQTVEGHWIPVPEKVALDRGPDPETGKPPLDEWVDDPDHDAFDFTRLEDGFYDKVSAKKGQPAVYFFDTGDPTLGEGSYWDKWGSIYRLSWENRRDPAGKTYLTLLARSDGPASGWASPDNGDMNADGTIMLQEDPAADPWALDESRIWAFERASDGSLINPAGKLVAQTLGSDCLEDSGGRCWETSGIEDVSRWFGKGAWIFDVQSKEALEDCPECVTNGQLLLMKLGGKFGFGPRP